MKKYTKVCSRMLAMVMVVMLTLSGCASFGSKVVSLEEFKTAMQEKNLEVTDITPAPDGATTACEAIAPEYHFEYVEMSDKKAAKSYYDTLVSDAKTAHPEANKVNGNFNDNYEFSADDDGYYFKSVKKGSTVLTVTTSSDDVKKEVKEILKGLGY